MLVFFRVIQGLGGGGLAPSEQAILADTFPPQKRGMAFAIYGMAVVLAPAIGPTLGGYITDNFDWRWIFFINVPVAIVSLILTSRLVEDPPHLKAMMGKAGKVDYIGLGLIAVGVGAGQVVLDKGQREDWFSSPFILCFQIASTTWYHFGDFLGILSSPSDDRHAVIQKPQFCGVLRDDVHAGCRAVRRDGAVAAIGADADGIYGRAGRPGDFAGRAW